MKGAVNVNFKNKKFYLEEFVDVDFGNDVFENQDVVIQTVGRGIVIT